MNQTAISARTERTPVAAPPHALPGIARDPQGKPRIGLDPESLYAFGHLIRLTEQLILDQFTRGLVSGTTHTCLGQELTAISVVRALDDPEDVVLSNHRNHGHFLTYSGDFVGLVAEIMGREAGVCGGWGGSQHLAYRHFHSNGVQGGMMGIGAGLALAHKLRGSRGIVAAMIGDGTLGQGLVYEAMNLASVWNAPLLVVVENNGIAQTTDSRHTIGGDIEARGAAFGLATWRYSDDDPEFFSEGERRGDRGADDAPTGLPGAGHPAHGTAQQGRRSARCRRARRHSRPRSAGRAGASVAGRHARGDRGAQPRVRRIGPADRERVARGDSRRDADAHLHRARRATAAPLSEHHGRQHRAPDASTRHCGTCWKRTRARCLLGEDLHDPYGGAFKVTQGLSTDFPGRVISTPISEAGITGASIGLSLDGFLPVMEVMFADFLSLCMDQLFNHAVKFPGMFRDVAVPLVIRTPCGGRRGYGPTHSQSPEHLFTAVPGLTVVYGSHRHDVGKLLIDAVLRWRYPVLFLEHKLLYGETMDAADYAALPAAGDVAAHLFPTLRRGALDPDVTLVSYGGMLPVVEAAARRLEEDEELAVEIVAPSLLSPLPRGSMIRHLATRHRVVIVEESHHDFGVSAEIAAAMLESGFKGQLLRIGTPPVPIASARSLERSIIPDEQSVVEQVLDLF